MKPVPAFVAFMLSIQPLAAQAFLAVNKPIWNQQTVVCYTLQNGDIGEVKFEASGVAVAAENGMILVYASNDEVIADSPSKRFSMQGLRCSILSERQK